MTTRIITLVSLALATAAPAAPRLFLSTDKLEPETQIELILDRPVVADTGVGKETANDWLQITPPLPGKLLWRAPNVARFLPDRAPSLGVSYTFALTKGRKHRDNSPVPAGVIATRATAPFQIDFATIPNRYNDGFSLRTAVYLLRFNDNVSPAAAAKFLSYTDKSKRRVAAKVWQPTGDETPQAQYLAPSWSDRFSAFRSNKEGATPTPPQPTTANLLLVAPAEPLPVGSQWHLAANAGLPNAANNSKLTEATTRLVGDIESFTLRGLSASINANEPRRLIASFSAKLPPDADLASFVEITPPLDKMSVKVDDNLLVIEGDLRTQDKWRLAIRPGIACTDGRTLAQGDSKELEFEYLEPGIALPSHDGAQLANGSRVYQVDTVNIGSLQVRAKRLTGNSLLRTLQAYRNYSGDGPNGQWVQNTAALPWDLIDAPTVANTTITLDNPIDTSRLHTLEWDKLLPADCRNAALFLDIRGTPKQDTGDNRTRGAQAIVQLTDLGIGWKTSTSDTVLYAFSCKTGKPLEGVTVDVFGEDAKPLGNIATGPDGLARLPKSPDARHLRATLGADTFAAAFDSDLPSVGLWHFPVRYSWEDPVESRRRVFLFTDRSLYRPGETVQLKGIVRSQQGNAIQALPAAPTRLVVLDPAEREILKQDVTLSPNGSFDHSLKLPATTVGTFIFRFEFSSDIEMAEALDEDDWSQRSALYENGRFDMEVPVAEFRRNAYEVTHDLAKPATAAASVDLAIAASYYQGQPVADAKVQAWTRVTSKNLYPENYRDYLFGNHREYDPWYWTYYFGCREDEYNEGRSESTNTEIQLDPQGKGKLSAAIPDSQEPATREVTISTEVTDSNNQTLTQSSSAVVHPADVYAGIGRIDKLVRINDQVNVPVVAISPDGKAIEQAVEVEVSIIREVHEQVKIANPNGTTSVRDEKREEAVSSAKLALDPKNNQGSGTPFAFHSDKPGRHILTVSGSDAAGHRFASSASIHVYGSDEYPWAYEDGIKIKLVAEKKQYRPGDTARILVLSPIEGTALVTVERERVLRTFVTELKASDPILEIPLSDEDAPNAYVSVLIIKGSDDSKRKFPEPQLRLGYCELTVENLKDRLAIKIDAPTQAVRPATEVTLTGTVTLADGLPAANAEVTLYAEDEGVLAVMGYENPDPMGFFHDPRNLDVRCGTSLDMFLPESPDSQDFFNKGFFVGGGGWDDLDASKLRRDFNPCALWAPALITGPDGTFKATFNTPDTLTRYRVLAVASHQASRFGSMVSSFVVNKPLMLEPKAPRFALQGDLVQHQVLVQNASDHSGTWQVTLTSNAPTIAQVAGTTPDASGASASQTVTLAKGASANLIFPVAFTSTGDASFAWRAIPVKLDNAQLDDALTKHLSDAVESRFNVDHPMPKLRAHQRVRLDAGKPAPDILAGIDAAIRGGSGEADLEFSRSLLLEAAGAVDYLLHYPYGCVEQTTSSMIPWFAVSALKPYVPGFAKHSDEEIKKAIQSGVDRLLTMQLADGGFSYWPDSDERVDWATSYAGLGLLLARESGARVPDGSIDSLVQDLTKSLRGVADTKSPAELETAARTVWVLALAGQAQDAYVNELRDRMPELNRRARCLLALACCASDQKPEATAILRDRTPMKSKDDPWMFWQPDVALDLIAWSTVDPTAPETTAALDKLLSDRSPYGHWRTTWVNAWSLIGLANYAENQKPPSESSVITLQLPDGLRTLTLNDENPTAAVRVPLATGLTIPTSTDQGAFLRVKVAAKPKIAPLMPVASNGLEVTRFHERVKADGTTEPLDRPAVGDLIRVSLRVTLPTDDTHYLVVEDLLPAIFETVNQEFKSQAAAGAAVNDGWCISHKELRDDRAVFFLDHVPSRGTYTIQYLARCTMAGEATAPPAKVESMYQPENTALSASWRVVTK